MEDQITKVRKTHSKKTEWGQKDNFAKSAKKANKQKILSHEDYDDEDDWQTQARNATMHDDIRDSIAPN